MNVLQTPPIHRPLENSISLSGITCLKGGNYSQRYIGSKKIIILPNGQLQIKPPEQSKPLRKISRKTTDTKHNNIDPTHTTCCSAEYHSCDTVRTYTIKKSIIRSRILAFINQQAGTKKLFFFTITFPPCIDDNNAYRFFNNWLSQLRTSKRLRSYLWVAERQQNGTIHYHIAIPHHVNIHHANKVMLTILCNAVRNKQINWNYQAAKRYNGIDIAKNRKTKRVTNFAVKKGQKSLSSYLTKYITKNNTSFTHYAWHCSRDFSNLIIKISFTKDECLTCGFELYINDERMFETDYMLFFPWRNKPPPQVTQHFAEINRHLSSYASELELYN